MRLNKFIAESGLCSRREADRLIGERRVSVNGRVAAIGVQVADGDEVRVNGQIVRSRQLAGARGQRVYLALNKPPGITSTTERSVRGNIVDFVDYPERIFPIGRLDKDSEGLILLTNDGDIVNPILRAEGRHEKEYLVSVDRPIDAAFCARMARGVDIGEAVTLPCRVEKLARLDFRIVLTQGLNRQIRRMCERLGFKVTRLVRVRIMNVQLGRLKLGQWRKLSAAELAGLKPARERPAGAGSAPDRA